MKRSARLVLVAAFVAGCATAGESTKGPVVSAKELPRTIAVLPLIPPADPDKEEPARVVTRMIHGSRVRGTADWRNILNYRFNFRVTGLVKP